MHPKGLFLQRCRQIEQLCSSEREIDFLDLAARLRQILLDQSPLIHAVNTYGIKIRFRVVLLRPIWEELPFIERKDLSFYSLEDGIDPELPNISPSAEIMELKLDGFLSHVICYTATEDITIGQAVKFAANVAGGIHHSPRPKPEHETQANLSGVWNVGGLPFGIRQIRAIGRVTLRGVAPLIAAVERELASPSELEPPEVRNIDTDPVP